MHNNQHDTYCTCFLYFLNSVGGGWVGGRVGEGHRVTLMWALMLHHVYNEVSSSLVFSRLANPQASGVFLFPSPISPHEHWISDPCYHVQISMDSGDLNSCHFVWVINTISPGPELAFWCILKHQLARKSLDYLFCQLRQVCWRTP